MVDVYEKLGVETIINAAGTLTAFGGSRMHPEVTDAMMAASRAFVDMDELHLAAGRRIAELIGVEAAHVCAGAAAGISLMAAACMAGAVPAQIAQLPDPTGMKHRFVVQRAHRNPFDQALRLVGGTFVEVEPEAVDLERAIDDQVAAVYYTSAWFCPGRALSLEKVAEIAHRAGVPVIVDAAAEVPPIENLTRFVRQGADLVAFSGGKAIRGPQASGFIIGRPDLIEACRLNDGPKMAIGRPMKTGREEIVGLVKALELYLTRDHAAEMAVWERRVAHVTQTLSSLDHVQVRRQFPFGVGQQIPHVALTWDEEALGVTHEQLVQSLRDGRPRIAVQSINAQVYGFAGFPSPEVRIHPHTLEDGEEMVVARRVRDLLSSGAEPAGGRRAARI